MFDCCFYIIISQNFLSKNMSFTSIVKRIEKINQKHKEIELRYNRRGKTCPRQDDLLREEQEDKHIYGYSHSQLLYMFKQRPQKMLEETRPCTAINQRTQSSKGICQTAMQGRNTKRAQSAAKPVINYRQQYNFLFKEDIFDQNHMKMRRTLPFKELNEEEEERLTKIFKNRRAPPSVKKLHSKSIKAEKANFINSFDQNLLRIQNKNGKTLIKVCKNKMTYEKRDEKPCRSRHDNRTMNEATQFQDVFRMTNINFDKQPLKKHKINISSGLQNLREIRLLLSNLDDKKFQSFDRQCQFGRSQPLHETSYGNLMPAKFVLTCVFVSTLQSIRIKLMMKAGVVVLQENKEPFNLQFLASHLLNLHPFVHFCFHEEGRKLIYEEFIINKSLGFTRNKQNQILLLTYYLDRFLLYDAQTSIKSVKQSTQLILKSNIDIPDEFVDFMQNLGSKLCTIFDKDCRLYSLSLKQILSNGLASILAFKKQMGFGQKVIKLRHGTRQQFKKYMYNWEYFYICSLLFIIKNQYLWQQPIFQAWLWWIRYSRALFYSTYFRRSSRVNFHGMTFYLFAFPFFVDQSITSDSGCYDSCCWLWLIYYLLSCLCLLLCQIQFRSG